jgi:hypothetical protein
MGRPKGSKNKKRKSYKNKPHNFRGAEDAFWTKVVKGIRNFLKSPFK